MWICPECRSTYPERAERCLRDAAPLAEVQAHQTKSRYPLLGRLIGERYHLIGGLGKGGLGTVYLAQHLHLDQLFALKFLDIDAMPDDRRQKEETRKDFIKEARVASLIRHESVVRVTDFGEYDGLPFLVMEYVPGPSLLHVLGQRGRFAEEEAISIARRIAEALDAFHERRLVHRDVKPANVILDPRGDGRLTLVDLGLVKDLSGPAGRASTHPLALRGTPGYLAPEQVPAWVLSGAGVNGSAEKRLVDARVDIYALGVIFYEMLAGVSPYPEGTNTQIIVYCCTHDPIPLTEVRPPVRLRPGLAELVYTTMSRDPDQRPASAAEFLERLDRVALGVTASRTSWPALVLPRSERLHDSVGGLLAPPRQAPPTPAAPTDLSVELEATHVFTDAEAETLEADGRSSFDLVLDHPLADLDLDEDLSQTTQIGNVPGLSEAIAEPPPDLVDAAVEAALRPAVRGRPPPEPPPPPLPARRARWPFIAASGVAVAAGVAAVLLWPRPDPPRAPQAPATDLEPATVVVESALAPDAVVVIAAPTPPRDASVPAPPVIPDAGAPEAPASRPPRHAPRTAPPSDAAPETEAPPLAVDPEDPAQALERMLARGRNAYKQRRYADALKYFRDFLAAASPDHLEYQQVRTRVGAIEQLLEQGEPPP